MNIAAIFEQGDGVLIGVFLTLLLMSLATWSFIFAGAGVRYRHRRTNRGFINAFWDARDLDQALRAATDSASPLARLVEAGVNGQRYYRARAHARLGDACTADEFLVRTLRNALNREQARLQSGLTLLASVGSTAPFIGLFGTVWGIYHALLDIAGAGQVTMAVVAGPLGEALVATAAGLATAIPAVLAYNAQVRANRVFTDAMDGFAHDLYAFLTTGAALRGAQSDAARARGLRTEAA